MDNSEKIEEIDSSVPVPTPASHLVDEDATDDVVFESYAEDGSSFKKTSPEDKIQKLKEKLIESEKLKQEYLDGWQRLKADYVNLKKRSEDEKGDLSSFVRESVVADLIPVVESFDMAFANKAAWENVDQNWRIGVEYIHKQFMETLSSYGLIEVNPVNAPFDPMLFTAIGTTNTDDQGLDHVVAEVVQKGYKMGDKLIRSPKVKVYSFEIKNPQ